MKKITSIFYNSHEYKALKGDPGETCAYDPSDPETPVFTLATTTGDSATAAMTQKAVTDELKKTVFFEGETFLQPLTAVIGNRAVTYDGGVVTVNTTVTNRATCLMYFPYEAMADYLSVVAPQGYNVSIYCTNTPQKKTSSTSSYYITSGWLDPGEVALAQHLNSAYPYVAISFKKTDGTDFTTAQLATLNAGAFLRRKVGTVAKDFNGVNVGYNLKALKMARQAESLHFPMQKNMYFNNSYGAFRTQQSGLRACIPQMFTPEFLLQYNTLTVPVGFEFSIVSVKHNGSASGANNDLENMIDGWHTGDGNAYTIGESINLDFPYVGINFKRSDDGVFSDADIATLEAGVTIGKAANNKGFRTLKVYSLGGELLGGIENETGDGALETLDRNSLLGALATTGTVGENTYEGEHILLKRQAFSFRRSLFKTLPSAAFAQSFAIYGDYILRFMYATDSLAVKIYNVNTNAYITEISLPYGSLAVPHCNTACFGRVFAQGNNDLPLLYLSQWNGERGCLVYDIRLNGTASLVQTILPDVSSDKFGAGQADWVVDYDQGFIYSIAYKIADGYDVTEQNGNRQMVCKFRLPKLSDGQSITFHDADIVDYYDVPPMNVMQDKCYRNGRIMVAAGGGSSSKYDTDWNRLYSLNLGKRRVEAVIPIYSFFAKEPEGLDMYGDLLLMDYNDSNSYGSLYAYEF